MRAWVVALVLALLACASSRPPVEACVRTSRVEIDPAFSPHEREDITRAENAWARAVGECFFETVDAPDLRIFRADKRGRLLSERGYERAGDAAGLWIPVRSEIWIVTEYYSDDQKATIAAHELGHYLGLAHRSEPAGTSVVNPVLSDDFLLVDGAEIPSSDVRAYRVITGR